MKIPTVFLSLGLLALSGYAADAPTKPGTSMGTAPAVRPGMAAPAVPEISGEQAMVALFSLLPLMQEFDATVKPLGSHYAPFTQWAAQTRQELQALVDAAKMGKTSGDIVVLSHKAKPQFEKAIKIAKAIVPLDADVHFMNSQIGNTSECLAKRQATVQQADAKVKSAVQLAMTGMPTSVSSLKSLVTEANAACP
jgi:hypothetical protein